MKALTVFFTIFLSNFTISAQAQNINTETSTIHWLGKKIGGQHEGFIGIKTGQLDVENEKITSGSFIINMTSITNTDLTDEGYNQKLVGHLNSDDFFCVENHPNAKLEIKKATSFSNGKASVNANLTIKGKTESILFDVLKTDRGYTAKIDVDRSKFDVRYGSDSFFDNLGDNVIDDIFTLDITLFLK